MAICKHRIVDKCKKDGKPCIFSKECFELEEQKPMTNADHIRSMSDEELGEFLEKAEWICHYNTFCETCLKHGADGNCIHMTEWLKQPYKENTDE